MALRWKIAQWFELRWWKNYLRDKDKVEYLAWKKNYWQGIFDRIAGDVRLDTSKTVIDMGCGPAGVFIALPQNKITAVDPLIDEYEKQSPIFRKADYPTTTFIKDTIEDFNAVAKYNVVFCMNCINHVIDIERGFNNLKAVCKDDGAIVITIDAHNFSFFKYFFRAIPGDILHPHQYNLEEYKNLLAKGGWKISEPQLLKKEFFFDHYLLVATGVLS